MSRKNVSGTKAEQAALNLEQLAKDELLNHYHEYKEIIDEFLRLQKKASDAYMPLFKTRMNFIETIPKKGHMF